MPVIQTTWCTDEGHRSNFESLVWLHAYIRSNYRLTLLTILSHMYIVHLGGELSFNPSLPLVSYIVHLGGELLCSPSLPLVSYIVQTEKQQQAESQSGGSGHAQDESGHAQDEEEHLLSPKIFFTPDTPCTRSIIHRANRTIAVAGILVAWSHSVTTCSAYLLRNDTRSTIITVSLSSAPYLLHLSFLYLISLLSISLLSLLSLPSPLLSPSLPPLSYHSTLLSPLLSTPLSPLVFLF